jgi:hypothetical protein
MAHRNVAEGQGRPGDPNYLRCVVDHLRTLGQSVSTPETRAEVVRHLNSKWEGVQAVAARVLGAWGGRDAVEDLRILLMNLPEKPYSTSLHGVIYHALADCIDESDTGWVLDEYFGLDGVLAKHEMRPLVWGVPFEAARTRLEAECLSQDKENRRAVMKAVTYMKTSVDNKLSMLHRLIDDPDPSIRSASRGWVEHLRKQRDAG